MELNIPDFNPLFSAMVSNGLMAFGQNHKHYVMSMDFHFRFLTGNCGIYLCFKSFFIINFDIQKVYDFVLNERPSFWDTVIYRFS